MPLLLRPAKEDDSARIARIGRDAFSDTISRSLFPPHLEHKSETGDPVLDEIQFRDVRNLRRMRAGKPTYVVVDIPEDGNGDGEVVGFAQWELPATESPAHDAVELEEEQFPASLDQEQLRDMFKAIDDATERVLGPDGHSNMWYLMSIAVDPAQQRRGIGKMLVQQGLDQAAKAGKDTFLIATGEGRWLYHSLGFQYVGEPVNLGTTPHYPMLWKAPDSGTS